MMFFPKPHLWRMTRSCKDGLEVMECDIEEQPMAHRQVVDGPESTVSILLGQQADIEDENNR